MAGAEAKSVLEWTCDDVGKWLKNNNFSKYVDLLCKQHQIDGPALLTLVETDMRQPPLQLQVLGDIKRLCICIRKLQDTNRDAMREMSVDYNDAVQNVIPEHLDTIHLIGSLQPRELDDGDTRNQFYSGQLEPEYFKLVLSYCYMFAVFLLTAFCMVIVHDRVPDMKKYPPLPDIVLDNIPYIPWAFEMCEITGLILIIIWFITLFFHKHRFILLRRTFSLLGSVFLLRCFTMLITSLSVPGVHLQCSPKIVFAYPYEYGDIWHKMHRALKIWQGFGMSLQGVRTCGDYMFSGHTVMVTLINFFITEYTPRKMYLLHTATWVMNIFAIFFILAAHEHYSIDVFIAFYISSRLFLYYHSLANNRVLRQRDSRRTRVWFPLFSFFESKVDGMVPNEYEWPLPWPQSFKAAFHKSPKKLKKR